MKRILTFAIAFMLIIVLAVPAFATEVYTLSGMYKFPDTITQPPTGEYEVVGYFKNVQHDNAWERFKIIKISSSGSVYLRAGTNVGGENFYSNLQLMYNTTPDGVLDFGTEPQVVDKELYDWVTSVAVPYVDECNGTTCPATDSNHDNICDDCARVLTMSLRSPLLEFAKSLADVYASGYPYYAVMAHPTDSDKLDLYISKSLMTAPDYENIVGSSMQHTTVFVDTDGSHKYTILAAVETFTGDLVYSNHTIENFRKPPLAVIIQGVTGEAMETEIPNLHRTMMVILLCGVGCLAFLILLPMLRRVFGTLRSN